MIYRLVAATEMYQRLLSDIYKSNGGVCSVPSGTLVERYGEDYSSKRLFIRVIEGPHKGYVRNAIKEDVTPIYIAKNGIGAWPPGDPLAGELTKGSSAKVVEINMQSTVLESSFDEGFYGPATSEVPLFFESLNTR
jgi:hypothetical protein